MLLRLAARRPDDLRGAAHRRDNGRRGEVPLGRIRVGAVAVLWLCGVVWEGMGWESERISICASWHSQNSTKCLDRACTGVTGVHPMARRNASGVSWLDGDAQAPWATPSWSPIRARARSRPAWRFEQLDATGDCELIWCCLSLSHTIGLLPTVPGVCDRVQWELWLVSGRPLGLKISSFGLAHASALWCEVKACRTL